MEYKDAFMGGYAMLGLLISLIMDIYSSGIKLSDFSFKKWVDDNLLRVILSVLCLIALFIFSEELIGIKMTPIMAFWTGIGNDNIINTFIRRKSQLNKKHEE